MEDQDLAVGGWSCTDPDRRDVELGGDGLAERVGDALEDDGEATGLLEAQRVSSDGVRRIDRTALHLETAHRSDRLGRQAQVAHHWNLSVDDRSHSGDPVGTALELDRIGPGPDQHRGRFDRLDRRQVVAHPRQVADDHRRRLRSRHRSRVVRHHVDADLERVVVAEDHVGHRVTDQDEVDAGRVEQPSCRLVIGRHHRQGRITVAALGRSDRRHARSLVAHRALLVVFFAAVCCPAPPG